MNDLFAPVSSSSARPGCRCETLVKILAIAVPVILSVAYLTFAERKVIGYMQVSIGPNRVGPRACCSRSPT